MKQQGQDDDQGRAMAYAGSSLSQKTAPLHGPEKKRLFPEKPEQNRQHQGYNQAGGQGKIKLEIPRLEDKITRQPPQI